MVTSQDQTQLQRSTSEANQSKSNITGLAAAAPLRPRLGRGSLRFSPYGKSLAEEKNILVGSREEKSSSRILESESFRRRGSGEEKRITADEPTLAQLESIGWWVKMSQEERGGRKGGQTREECQLSETSNERGKGDYKLKERRLAEELRRIYSDKAMEVFSTDLKALELSN